MSTAPRLKDYALWLLPSEEESKPLCKLVSSLVDLESASPDFTPHITLWHPVPKTITLAEITSTLSAWVKSLQAEHDITTLSLDLRPAQSGETYYQSVIAPVEPVPALLDLREECERMWGPAKKEYFPHLSLFYGDVSMSRRDEIADIANSRGTNEKSNNDGQLLSKMTIRQVVVVDMEGEPNEWKIVSRVDLS